MASSTPRAGIPKGPSRDRLVKEIKTDQAKAKERAEAIKDLRKAIDDAELPPSWTQPFMTDKDKISKP
jgi:hypothetical protein